MRPVVEALKAHALAAGVSLEEEVRQILTDTVLRRRRALKERMDAARAQIASELGRPELDSVRIIREERDAWG